MQPLWFGWSQGEAVSSQVPNTARTRNAMWPDVTSTRRASSDQGRRPARLLFSDSVTSASPEAVV